MFSLRRAGYYLGNTLGLVGVLALGAMVKLEESWPGHRPVTPVGDDLYPINDHGVLYVSAADLQHLHTFQLIAGGCIAVSAISLAVWNLTARNSTANENGD